MYRSPNATPARENPMNTWQSHPIHVDGMHIDVRADKSGVTCGKTVEGVYASDLLLSPEQALAYAAALQEAAIHCRAMRANP